MIYHVKLVAMTASLYFYDLETSGFNPKSARIMQFAGQRTTLDLQPIGEPVNVLVKLTPDVLPDPDAILVTGITPQQTLQGGVTEFEFLKLFYKEVDKPGTIYLGFNSIRFDDEFMRYLNYRNFYDAYEWQWKDGRARWDLLDVVRMTRALRPDGIEWPFAPDGKPTNRLEFLTAANKLDHFGAHDALADVKATIEVAKLIRSHQPDLFDYLRQHSGKKETKAIVERSEPFVYTTGRYPSEFHHTSVAVLLCPHPEQDSALVYDLRVDPTPFFSKTPEQLADHWRFSRAPEHVGLPVKTLKYNRCPAVAPLGVLSEPAQQRIQLTLDSIRLNLKSLRNQQQEFASKVVKALRILDAERDQMQTSLVPDERDVDTKLYAGFFSATDKTTMSEIRASKPDEISTINIHGDERLSQLIPLYKARNFPTSLTGEERKVWDEYCHARLQSGGKSSRLAKFAGRLQELSSDDNLKQKDRFLLEELKLYAESIIQLELDDSVAT